MRIKKIIVFLLVTVINFLIADYFLAYFDYAKRQHEYRERYLANGGSKTDKEYCNFPFYYTYMLFRFQDRFSEEYKVKDRLHGVEEGYTRPGILVFGSSYAEGLFLGYYENLDFYLSDKTKRTVYNFAYGGMSVLSMLYGAQNDSAHEYIGEKMKKLPEYAIYVYIDTDVTGIYNDKYVFDDYYKYQLGYNLRNGQLVPMEKGFGIANVISLLTRFQTGKIIFRKYFYENPRVAELTRDIFVRVLYQSREELQKRYPGMKFVIIKYPMVNTVLEGREECIEPEIWEKLKSDGFIVYDAGDIRGINLKDSEYSFPDGHPKSKTWDVVTDNLIKDLNL